MSFKKPVNPDVIATFQDGPNAIAAMPVPVGELKTYLGTVAIDNFTWSPLTMKTNNGTEVTWTNNDDIRYSIVLWAVEVHSKALDTGNTFTYQFDHAGAFSYMCGLHPHTQVVVR